MTKTRSLENTENSFERVPVVLVLHSFPDCRLQSLVFSIREIQGSSSGVLQLVAIHPVAQENVQKELNGWAAGWPEDIFELQFTKSRAEQRIVLLHQGIL